MVNITSLVIVATTVGILASIVVPETQQALVAAKGQASSANLRMIERAKQEFARDYPTSDPTEEDIASYLPGYVIPKGVHQGEVYLNITDLSLITESSVNGQAAFEPRGAAGSAALSNNYNDLGYEIPLVKPAVYIDLAPLIAKVNKVQKYPIADIPSRKLP